MQQPDSPTPAWLAAIATLAGIATAAWLGYLALSQELPAPRPAATERLGAPPSLAPCVMERNGFWRGRITGSASLDVDWSGADLACAGNARPAGRGLRLFFAGRPGAGTERLVLVIGIEAGLDELAGREHEASVTLIDEASSQFFHGAANRCFTRVREVAPLPDARSWRVEGELYCAGAIAAVAGVNSVTLGDMAYAGRLTLEEP